MTTWSKISPWPLKVTETLEENIDDIVPIGFLIRDMDEHLKDSTSEAYSYRHMKRKLSEHFSDNVIFTDDNRGRSNETVVTLKNSI